MNKKIRAFTLMEIVIVIIIISLVIAFAVPNYSKSIKKAQEKNMLTNLRAIRAAVVIYTAAGGSVGDWGDLSTINTNLGLGLIDPKANYQCKSGAPSYCWASIGGWAVMFQHPDSVGGIFCYDTGLPCPTCPFSAAGNCG